HQTPSQSDLTFSDVAVAFGPHPDHHVPAVDQQRSAFSNDLERSGRGQPVERGFCDLVGGAHRHPLLLPNPGYFHTISATGTQHSAVAAIGNHSGGSSVLRQLSHSSR